MFREIVILDLCIILKHISVYSPSEWVNEVDKFDFYKDKSLCGINVSFSPIITIQLKTLKIINYMSLTGMCKQCKDRLG